MMQIDEMVAALCDEVSKIPPNTRLDVVGELATYLIEFAAYDIARNHNSADSVAVFIIATDFERRMRSVKESGQSANIENDQNITGSFETGMKTKG